MAAIEQPSVDLREPAGWRRTKNQVATTLMVLAFVAVLIPLGFVLFTVIGKGASAINWQFLTGGPIPPNVVPAGIGGLGPAVYGTLVITGLAALMAVRESFDPKELGPVVLEYLARSVERAMAARANRRGAIRRYSLSRLDRRSRGNGRARL